MSEQKISKQNREKMVVKTSIIGILTNIILVGLKIVVGIFSNSIAIISDALNNLSDVISSVATIIGVKLSNKPPDKDHPFGHGRAEYLSALAVSIIIIYAGLTALIESVKKIISPEPVNYSIITVLIVAISIIVKLLLSSYTRKKGKKFNSTSLVASGFDALNDALLSISVLASILIFIFFNINIEAYVSAVLSLVIIKTGVMLIRKSINDTIGTRAETKLSTSIKRDIEKEEGVKGAFDLVLNNYGPDQFLGSVNIEVEDKMTAREIDGISRKISKHIFQKYGILLHAIGIYSINTHDKEAIKMRNQITKEILSMDGIKEIHGFYFDEEEKTISFDIVIDYGHKNRHKLRSQVFEKIQTLFPNYKLNITEDIDFGD